MGALFTRLSSQIQESLRVASTAAALTDVDPGAFAEAARPAIDGGLFDGIAVVRQDGPGYRTLLGEGVDGSHVEVDVVAATLDRAKPDGSFVSSAVFDDRGQRRIAFASLVRRLEPRTLVYAQIVLADPEPDAPAPVDRLFGDLKGALYVGTDADATQAIIVSPDFALTDGGRTAGALAASRAGHRHPPALRSAGGGGGDDRPIGAGVLRSAARDCARWRAEHPGAGLTVAVNLSAHQLRHADLVDEVRVALDMYGLEPAALTLELTKTVLMEDAERHIDALHQLRALGVRRAIDDFGTGYSSLTYLKRFPVDIIKIDRSFVAGLDTDHCDTAIVRSVIDLAHALDLVVVGEGVERPEQFEALRRLGCDVVQGYPFSRPQPVDVISDWLADRLVPTASLPLSSL